MDEAEDEEGEEDDDDDQSFASVDALDGNMLFSCSAIIMLKELV